MLHYLIETVGWIGAALMLSAYLLLTVGRMTAQSALYKWMNALSAAGFIVNSGWNGAYPSASINVIWLAISLYGLLGRPVTRPVEPN